MKKTIKFQILCLLTIGLLACSSTNTPSDTIKAWYDCVERKDANCLLNYSSDGFIARFGGASAFKETWEETFKQKKKVTYVIDEETSTETTAEIKVSEETYLNSSNKPHKGKMIWILEKNGNGTWKVKDWITMDLEY